MFSIDQNSHSLWDVLPKIEALAARGESVTHFIEDIDVAFTEAGADMHESRLRVERERYHRGGVADWGAALFYSEFLGRLPVDVRQWEDYTGMKTSALARKLGRDVEQLYDDYSPADNWQLIGPSYLGDREHHRVIGDLTVAETEPFVREILTIARRDCENAFPDDASRRGTAEWFDREQATVDALMRQCAGGKLVDLYHAWLAGHTSDRVQLALTSRLFANHADAGRSAILETFLKDYDQAAGLYNRAVEEAGVGLRPLDTGKGELPFFAVMSRDGHLVRTSAWLDAPELRCGERSYRLAADRKLPLDAMQADGVLAVAGKAVVLVLQARAGRDGQALALPHHGSPYVPASHALERMLRRAGLLSAALKPLVRVRFRLLDRLAGSSATVALPTHLRWFFGRDRVPARQLADGYAELAAQATRRLESFRDEEDRRQWQREALPDVVSRIDSFDAKRRELAKHDPKSPQIRELGKRQKELELKLLTALVGRISDDWQSARIDYYDSRGALLPWCVALGGEEMYNDLLSRADIHEEGAGAQ